MAARPVKQSPPEPSARRGVLRNNVVQWRSQAQVQALDERRRAAASASTPASKPLVSPRFENKLLIVIALAVLSLYVARLAGVL